MIRANRPKYGNKKITIPSGEVFDSKREYQRWLILKEAETKGIISDLERQPTFELIPKITEKYIKHLKTKDKECERVTQLPCTYTPISAITKTGW